LWVCVASVCVVRVCVCVCVCACVYVWRWLNGLEDIFIQGVNKIAGILGTKTSYASISHNFVPLRPAILNVTSKKMRNCLFCFFCIVTFKPQLNCDVNRLWMSFLQIKKKRVNGAKIMERHYVRNISWRGVVEIRIKSHAM